jgi:copper chaperone
LGGEPAFGGVGPKKPKEDRMERLTLTIDGMSCSHCVQAVTAALRGVPGVVVKGVEVGRALLIYDLDSTSPEVIEQAVTNAGYDARRVAA